MTYNVFSGTLNLTQPTFFMLYMCQSADDVSVVDSLAKALIVVLLQRMTPEYGYVWFLPPWFTKRWWNTDIPAFPTEEVPCTSAEMLLAVQGHFILSTAYLGDESSQIVGNCTVANWVEAYEEHVQALVSSGSRHFVSETCK